MPQALSPSSPYATLQNTHGTSPRRPNTKLKISKVDPTTLSPEQVAQAIHAYAPAETSPILEKLALDNLIDGRTLVSCSEDLFSSLTGDERLTHDFMDVSERLRRRAPMVRSPVTPRSRPLRLIVQELETFNSPTSQNEENNAALSPPESEPLSTPQADFPPEWDFGEPSQPQSQEDSTMGPNSLINLGALEQEGAGTSSLLFDKTNPELLSVLHIPHGLPLLHSVLESQEEAENEAGSQPQDETVGRGDHSEGQDDLLSRQHMPTAGTNASAEPVQIEANLLQASEKVLKEISIQTEELAQENPTTHDERSLVEMAVQTDTTEHVGLRYADVLFRINISTGGSNAATSSQNATVEIPAGSSLQPSPRIVVQTSLEQPVPEAGTRDLITIQGEEDSPNTDEIEKRQDLLSFENDAWFQDDDPWQDAPLGQEDSVERRPTNEGARTDDGDGFEDEDNQGEWEIEREQPTGSNHPHLESSSAHDQTSPEDNGAEDESGSGSEDENDQEERPEYPQADPSGLPLVVPRATEENELPQEPLEPLRKPTETEETQHSSRELAGNSEAFVQGDTTKTQSMRKEGRNSGQDEPSLSSDPMVAEKGRSNEGGSAKDSESTKLSGKASGEKIAPNSSRSGLQSSETAGRAPTAPIVPSTEESSVTGPQEKSQVATNTTETIVDTITTATTNPPTSSTEQIEEDYVHVSRDILQDPAADFFRPQTKAVDEIKTASGADKNTGGGSNKAGQSAGGSDDEDRGDVPSTSHKRNATRPQLNRISSSSSAPGNLRTVGMPSSPVELRRSISAMPSPNPEAEDDDGSESPSGTLLDTAKTLLFGQSPHRKSTKGNKRSTKKKKK